MKDGSELLEARSGGGMGDQVRNAVVGMSVYCCISRDCDLISLTPGPPSHSRAVWERTPNGGTF